MNTQTLINEALSLPVEQRTLVVESLLASLSKPTSTRKLGLLKGKIDILDEFLDEDNNINTIIP